MKQTLTLALALLLLPAAQAQTSPRKDTPPAAAQAMVRVVCDGPSSNAEITVNGEFKGDCPFDFAATAGTLKLRALKKIDAGHERVFELEFRLAAGTVKRVEVELGPPQLTAEGRRLEQARMQREAELAEDQQRAARETARLAEAAAITRNNALADALLTEDRTVRGISNIPDCPDCPRAATSYPRFDTSVPTSADPESTAWLLRLKQSADGYLATAGADFRPPAQAVPLPCTNAAFSMRSLADMLSMSERPLEEQQNYRARVKSSSLPYVRDVKLWPVQAACRDGQLDGPLDFWAYSLSIQPWAGDATQVVAIPTLTHVQVTMASGQAAGPIWMVSRTRRASRSSDPAGSVESIRFNLRSSSETTQLRMAALLFTAYEKAPSFLKPPTTPYVSITTPLDDERSEQLGYDNGVLQTRGFFRRGKNHGPLTVYTTRPPTVHCYQNGARSTLSPCPAD